jgi:hypothetical protein
MILIKAHTGYATVLFRAWDGRQHASNSAGQVLRNPQTDTRHNEVHRGFGEKQERSVMKEEERRQ